MPDLNEDRSTKDKIFEGSSTTILENEVNTIVIGFGIVNFDEEGLIGAMFVHFEEYLFLDEGLVEFIDLGGGVCTLMICFLEICLMANCSLLRLASSTSPKEPSPNFLITV